MRKLFFILVTLIAACAAAQTADRNYIVHSTMLDSTAARQATTVLYYDGIGRPTLQASNATSGDGSYASSMKTYIADDMLKEEWLPVPGQPAAGFMQESVFMDKSQEAYGDRYACTLNTYDGLRRIMAVSVPGKAWRDAGRGKGVSYGTNGASEVIRYEAPADGTFRLVENGHYPKGTLWSETSTDEDGHCITVFTDLYGNRILERRAGDNDTYYVYDDRGDLRFVLSPEYGNGNDLEGLCYEYRYDGRHRCIWKRLPGCEPVECWYDCGDRLVCFRDGEMRGKGIYRFYLYDGLGRVAVQGTCTRCYMGTDGIRNVSYNPSSGGLSGSLYTVWADKDMPQNATVEKIYYYDDYTFLRADGPHKKDKCFAVLDRNTDARAQGMVTGTVTYTAGGKALCGVTYYDGRLRPADVRQTYTDGYVVVTKTEFSFTGNPVKVQHTLHKDGKAVPVAVNNRYGNSNDMIVSSTMEAAGSEISLAEYEYDGLGRLETVRRGGGAVYQQYSYNVRGWMTEITGNGFREKLYYADTENPCYNGNISRIIRDNNVPYPVYHRYDFIYDMLDRITSARYGFYAGSKLNYDNSEYFTYNANGSPLTLKRYGAYNLYGTHGYDKVNDLTFEYDGNQVTGINNSGAFSAYSSPHVFKKNYSDTRPYTYNANGAQTFNPDRYISRIEYDDCTNPVRIQFQDGSVTEYVYDADGNKLKTVHRTAVTGAGKEGAGTGELTEENILAADSTLYAGPFVITGNGTRYIFDGGYAVLPESTGGDVIPFFFVKDHLGSVAVVMDGSGNVVERNNYYPSGALFSESTNEPTNICQYKYNCKELDTMHGLYRYDYVARMYDPAVFLWDRMDPLCEKYYNISPYVYCADNPVNAVDPDGRSIWSKIVKAGVKIGAKVAKNGFKELGKAATYADAVSDITDNVCTLFDKNASALDKIGAGVSLASEFLPVSIGDIKDAGKVVKKITPNWGKTKPHGGKVHNDVIDKRIESLRNTRGVKDIRKNQAQVDYNGNKVGNNRPDIQYNKGGKHYNIEYDANPRSSEKHRKRIEENDPNAINEFNKIEKQ